MAIFQTALDWLLVRVRRFGWATSDDVRSHGGERRRVPRRLYMRQGYLTFPIFPAHPPLDCVIRDLSPVGAQIELAATPEDHLLLGAIRLYIADKNHERDCKIVWRRDLLVGFKFEGKPVPTSRDYSHPTQRGRLTHS